MFIKNPNRSFPGATSIKYKTYLPQPCPPCTHCAYGFHSKQFPPLLSFLLCSRGGRSRILDFQEELASWAQPRLMSIAETIWLCLIIIHHFSVGVLLHRLQSAAGRVCLMSFCPQYLIPPAVLLPRNLLPIILVRSSSELSLISVKAISSPLKCICKSKTEVLTHFCVWDVVCT